MPAHQPEWRLMEANDWRKRAGALQLFIEAVRKVVFSGRMRKRLEKIQDVLGEWAFWVL